MAGGARKITIAATAMATTTAHGNNNNVNRQQTIRFKSDLIFILPLIGFGLAHCSLVCALQASSRAAGQLDAGAWFTSTDTGANSFADLATTTVAAENLKNNHDNESPQSVASGRKQEQASTANGANQNGGAVASVEKRQDRQEAEDIVISSSEILSDNGGGIVQTGSGAHEKPNCSPAEAMDFYRQQTAQRVSSNGTTLDDELAIRSFVGGEVRIGLNQTATGYPNPRAVLNLLVICLSALLFVSLMLAYLIKFCICRLLRKRRGDLVADSSLVRHPVSYLYHDHHQQALPTTTTNGLGFGLLSSPQCPCPLPGEIGSINYRQPVDRTVQQLALVERLVYEAQLQGNSSYPQDGDGLNSDHVGAGGCLRPPAYAELFGPSLQPIAQTESCSSCTSSVVGEPQDTRQQRLANDLQQSQQRNLLVKLNLNKTKLLSAEDLVLLSKLIDVPIVVQQQQQRQRQQVQDAIVEELDENEAINGANGTTTITTTTTMSASQGEDEESG